MTIFRNPSSVSGAGLELGSVVYIALQDQNDFTKIQELEDKGFLRSNTFFDGADYPEIQENRLFYRKDYINSLDTLNKQEIINCNTNGSVDCWLYIKEDNQFINSLKGDLFFHAKGAIYKKNVSDNSEVLLDNTLQFTPVKILLLDDSMFFIGIQGEVAKYNFGFGFIEAQIATPFQPSNGATGISFIGAEVDGPGFFVFMKATGTNAGTYLYRVESFFLDRFERTPLVGNVLDTLFDTYGFDLVKNEQTGFTNKFIFESNSGGTTVEQDLIEYDVQTNLWTTSSGLFKNYGASSAIRGLQQEIVEGRTTNYLLRRTHYFIDTGENPDRYFWSYAYTFSYDNGTYLSGSFWEFDLNIDNWNAPFYWRKTKGRSWIGFGKTGVDLIQSFFPNENAPNFQREVFNWSANGIYTNGDTEHPLDEQRRIFETIDDENKIVFVAKTSTTTCALTEINYTPKRVYVTPTITLDKQEGEDVDIIPFIYVGAKK